MSGAKHKMRNKKMRNQPSNVTGWVRGHQSGGPQTYAHELPTAITASGFIKARVAEVNAMLKAVTQRTASAEVLGALPKHMRRRAMSHNTKRLPCRLRQAANKTLDKSQKEKKEQPKSRSRKARRRHGNLLLEFNRRQRRSVWLETHIWHAKRFHMVRRWGYCLGERPTYKCYRACYRAMSGHCLLQDLSYYCCVELQGPEDQLLAGLAQLTCKDSGPTFAAGVCLSGRRQGSTMVYRAGQAPAQPLGPVLFLWRPRAPDSTHRQLWLWAHPTLKQDLLPELQNVCCCSEVVPPPTAPPVEMAPPPPTPVEMAPPPPIPVEMAPPAPPTPVEMAPPAPPTPVEMAPPPPTPVEMAPPPPTPVEMAPPPPTPVEMAPPAPPTPVEMAPPPPTPVEMAPPAPPTPVEMAPPAPPTPVEMALSAPPTPVEMALSAPVPFPAPALAPTSETKNGLVLQRTKASTRKRSQREAKAAGPPAKKILGDGTRSPTAPTTWKSSSTGIVISDLTMEIVRYRLIGPQSHSVLTETLEAATDCDAVSKAQTSCFWWPEHCKDEGNMSLHRQQAAIFGLLKGIFSTAEVPSGSVLGLTVDDPRLTLPRKRGKAMPNLQQAQEVDEEGRRGLILRGVPECCSQSSLWDRSVRDNVTEHKISEQDLNRQRRDVLVPGSSLRPPPQSRVPVLLVQQPGKQVGLEQPSWGAGWDLLLPKAWGMAFWVPLVYRGVRVGGLKMALKHSQNKGAPHFPHDYPDCPSGQRFQLEQEEELLAKFKRRPPAKRPNYIKHGCLAPFRCPWQQLAEEWELIVREGGEEEGGGGGGEGEGESLAKTTIPPVVPKTGEVTSQGDGAFTVLRNRKSLRQLSVWCRPTSSKGQRSQRQWAAPQLTPAAAASVLASHRRSLVWVRLSLLCKGQPEPHAQVCVPAPADLLQQRGESGPGGPQEPLHADHFKSRLKRRKKTRQPGSSSSCKANSQQSGPSSTLASDPCPDTTPNPTTSPSPGGSALTSTPCRPNPSSSSSSSSSALTLGLWPEPLPSVSSHCSRLTLGWVTQGDFSLSAGCGEALGLVSLPGLLRTLLDQPEGRRGLVLLRNPASLQYRLAKLNVEA